MQQAIIQMRNVDRPTCQCCQQVDITLVDEIIVHALELGMFLLVEHDDDVAGNDTGLLIAFACACAYANGVAVSSYRSYTHPSDTIKNNFLPIDHALLHKHLQDLLLRRDLLAIAHLALVLFADGLAGATAIWAHLLDLLDHRAHLSQLDAHTLAIAPTAWMCDTEWRSIIKFQ